jgi:CheY-like chemotaxis protein
MATLRKKYHDLGNKINNALLLVGTVRKNLLKRNDASLERSIRDCSAAEEELLALAREMDSAKSVTYRLADPDKELARIAQEFSADNRGIKLLFVDDDTHLCALLKRNYEARGFDVRSATSLGEAKRRIVEDPPHILVLDLYLDDGMDGAEVLRFVRDKGLCVKCLVVSREFDEARLDDVRALGAGSVLRKPVTADELEARINGLAASIRG